MIALGAYALLLVITAGYVKWTLTLWRRTGDMSILIGAAIIYAWTFLGAWAFIGDAALGFPGYRVGFSYYYLMEKMFPFVLDGDYVLSIALYGVFAFALLGTLQGLLPASSMRRKDSFLLSREVLIATGLGALMVSAWAILPVFRQAIDQGRSVYLLLHEFQGWRHSVHALCNEAAAAALVWGFAVHLMRQRNDAPFMERGWFLPGWSYAIALVVLCAYLTGIEIGHTLFAALVLSVTYMLCVGGKRALRPVTGMILVCAVALAIGGEVRAAGWGRAGTNVPKTPEPAFTLPAIVHVPRVYTSLHQRIGEGLFTNEFFCAHFSFYGVLTRHVQPDPGVSFRYLVRALGPVGERPITAYDHYAAAAHLTAGQGYTIHQATAWYLNFGWVGLVLGGVALGGIWALLFRLRERMRTAWGGIAQVLPWLFVAYLPPVMRSGPEAYKALLVEGLLLPLLAIAPALVVGLWYNSVPRNASARP